MSNSPSYLTPSLPAPPPAVDDGRVQADLERREEARELANECTPHEHADLPREHADLSSAMRVGIALEFDDRALAPLLAAELDDTSAAADELVIASLARSAHA